MKKIVRIIFLVGLVSCFMIPISAVQNAIAYDDLTPEQVSLLEAIILEDVEKVRDLTARKDFEVNFFYHSRYGNLIRHPLKNALSSLERTSGDRTSKLAIIKMLLDAGASISDIEQSGTDILGWCIKDAELVALLAGYGADLEKPDREGSTRLMKENDVQAIRSLIMAGADVRSKNKKGFTPLHAVQDPEIVKLMVERGADLEADYEGYTPLLYAVGYGRIKIVDALIEAGANLDVKGSQGWTALHWAVYYRNKKAVQALVRAGASTEIANDKGKRPIDMVRMGKPIYTILEQALPRQPRARRASLGADTPPQVQRRERRQSTTALAVEPGTTMLPRPEPPLQPKPQVASNVVQRALAAASLAALVALVARRWYGAKRKRAQKKKDRQSMKALGLKEEGDYV